MVDANAPSTVRVVDVSDGGMGIISAEGFRRGQVLPINLLLPTYEERTAIRSVYFVATVTFQILSAGQFRVGLQFGTLDTKTREGIAEWIIHGTPLPAPPEL